MFSSHISAHVAQTLVMLGDNTRGAASMQLDESSVITLSMTSLQELSLLLASQFQRNHRAQ